MEFFSYFTKVESIVQLVEFVFFGIISIILFAKTGNTKTLNNLLTKFCDKKEVNEMKYRTENYVEKEKVEGQKFDNLLKVYRVNKVTNELEETGETIDIQEMINSSLSSCMTEVLSKFFPDNVPVDDENVLIAQEMQDDLDYLQDTFAVAEKYRDMYNLDPAMSVREIFDFIKFKSNELTNSLSNKEEIKQEEVASNETQNVEKSE